MAVRDAKRNPHPRTPPAGFPEGFVVVRDADGEFHGALGTDQLDPIVSPETQPPWEIAADAVDPTAVFSFLANTIFTAYDRRRMLAAAREIEERAWRADAGQLFAGFQRVEAFEDQRYVYERFVRETDVPVRLFVAEAWDESLDALPIVSDAGDEIGAFWFVLFDGGESRYDACGLLAEEREPGSFYGFWTYEPARVAEIVTYLRTEYIDP